MPISGSHRAPRRQGRVVWSVVLILGAAGALYLLGALTGRSSQPAPLSRVIAAGFASLLFGALVGLSEILSRYRDEPILAATTASGVAYLMLNGVIALAAFAVMRRYSTAVFPAVKDDLFLTAIVAGFGGMTVFRSKLFTYRATDGKEYAIGPAIVLDTVLRTIDHKIDRRRATERQARVTAAFAELNDFEHVSNYIEASLNSFQNLTIDEKREITDVIEQYRKSVWPAELKIMALGFAFLNIAGEENFDEVVRNVRAFLATLPVQTPPP
jgi:ABC-type transport system involved in multi-copper enzyme maturation permease subunit